MRMDGRKMSPCICPFIRLANWASMMYIRYVIRCFITRAYLQLHSTSSYILIIRVAQGGGGFSRCRGSPPALNFSLSGNYTKNTNPFWGNLGKINILSTRNISCRKAATFCSLSPHSCLTYEANIVFVIYRINLLPCFSVRAFVVIVCWIFFAECIVEIVIAVRELIL